MEQAYLLLAFERRVLNVVLDDDPDAIQRAIGYQTVKHSTTFQTEDQLIVSADEFGGAPSDQFWVVGVPFPVQAAMQSWSASIRLTGDTADRPVMSIDEFGRLITFVGPLGPVSGLPVLSSALGGLPPWRSDKPMRASKRSRNRRGVGLPLDHRRRYRRRIPSQLCRTI